MVESVQPCVILIPTRTDSAENQSDAEAAAEETLREFKREMLASTAFNRAMSWSTFSDSDTFDVAQLMMYFRPRTVSSRVVAVADATVVVATGRRRLLRRLDDSSDESDADAAPETPAAPARKRTLLCESSDEAEDADSEEEEVVPMTEQQIEDERIRKKQKKQAWQASDLKFVQDSKAKAAARKSAQDKSAAIAVRIMEQIAARQKLALQNAVAEIPPTTPPPQKAGDVDAAGAAAALAAEIQATTDAFPSTEACDSFYPVGSMPPSMPPPERAGEVNVGDAAGALTDVFPDTPALDALDKELEAARKRVGEVDVGDAAGALTDAFPDTPALDALDKELEAAHNRAIA